MGFDYAANILVVLQFLVVIKGLLASFTALLVSLEPFEVHGLLPCHAPMKLSSWLVFQLPIDAVLFKHVVVLSFLESEDELSFLTLDAKLV